MVRDNREPSRLRIVQLTAPAEVGGLERVVQGLSRGLLRRGHSVATVAVVEPGVDARPFLDPMEAAGVETLTLQCPGRGYLRERRAVHRFLRRFRPHVLHTHGYRSDLLHGGSARRKGIATFSTLHGSSRLGGLSHLFEWLQLRALREFDGVVAVSRPLEHQLLEHGVPTSRIHRIPNAWTPGSPPLARAEARMALEVSGDRPVVGWVGRLIPIKGCDVFLRALAELPPHGPSWQALILGDGPERNGLEALSDKLGLGDSVRFLGSVPDAARLFGAFDLFVLSSHSEGTPIVLLEAMGASVPIIATRVGGVPDLLAEGAAGILAPPGSPRPLGAAIHEALVNPEEALHLGAEGRRVLDRDYRPGVWVRRHEAVYRSVLRMRR